MCLMKFRLPWPDPEPGLVLLLMAMLCSPVSAHEFWLEPSNYDPPLVSSVRISVMVGEGFAGRSLPRDDTHIDRFVVLGRQGEAPVMGTEGLSPAGFLRLTNGGPLVVGYLSHPTYLELPADRFNRHLEHQGLESVINRRKSLGLALEPGREAFYRCAKTIVGWDGLPHPVVQNRLGFPLEIIPVQGPSKLGFRNDFVLQVLYRDRPLEGALVTATHRYHRDDRHSQRSDADGRVSFPLQDGGAWLISAVHMVPAVDSIQADWESYWASLTFSIPATQSTSPEASSAP